MLRYYPQFCIASIAATAILLIMYFMKRNYKTESNKIFFVMVIDNLLASAVNITTFYTISFPERYPVWADYLSNISYLLIYNFMSVLYLLYVRSRLRLPKLKNLLKHMAMAIVAYDGITVLTSPATHLVAYFDATPAYRHGPLMMTLYLTAFIAVAGATIAFFHERKKFNSYQVFSITGFACGVFGAIIFQFFNPPFVITNFACAMALFFLYTAFENQAYYLYDDTPCYNRRAFINTIHQNMQKNTPYVLTVIKVDGSVDNAHYMNKHESLVLSHRIAGRLSRKFGKSSYCVSMSTYTVIENDTGQSSIENDLLYCFKEPFLLNSDEDNHMVKISPSITIIKVSDMQVEGVEMLDVINMMPVLKSGTTITQTDLNEHLKAIRREKEVLQAVTNAIRHNKFQVYYQPIKNVKTNTFTSAEALVRLIDPEIGFISPEEFIPIAEKHGLITDIGNFVFEEVCRFMQSSHIRSYGIDYIEINLSPAQCRKEELAESLLATMAQYNIDPSHLNLEITETADAENYGIHILNDIMGKLNQYGVTFSLDDFGSGFSAINYLIELPVGIVKIDKQILWQAMKDDTSRTILEDTMAMIKKIGKEIVVEGVETEEMVNFLKTCNCDYMQGFLYSKPVPGADFVSFIQKNN